MSQVHRGLEILIQLQPDLVLCAGDMVAGQKLGLTSNQLDAMWSAFDEQILQPLRTVEESFAPTMGNHDASNSRGHSGYLFELDRLHAQKCWRARQGSLGLTFVDAHQGDYYCYVIEDCTTGSSKEAHESALKAMEYLQNGTVVSRSQMIEKIDKTTS